MIIIIIVLSLKLLYSSKLDSVSSSREAVASSNINTFGLLYISILPILCL